MAAEESTFWAVNLTSKNSEVMSVWDLERSNLGGRDLEAGPSDTFEPFMIISNRPPDHHFKVPPGLVIIIKLIKLGFFLIIFKINFFLNP